MKSTKVILIAGAVLLLLVVLSLVHRSREGFALTENPGGKFVMYYANWCPHCKTVKPEFEAFAKNGTVEINGKKVGVALVEEKEKAKMEGKPVKGFPTFLYETVDGQTVEYSGPRTTDGWKAFLAEQVKN